MIFTAQRGSAGAVGRWEASGFGLGMVVSFLGLGVMEVPKHPDFGFRCLGVQQRSGRLTLSCNRNNVVSDGDQANRR